MIEPEKTQPPWIVFPEMHPTDLRATQGPMEFWLDEVWWPFWMGITEADRDVYLLYWECDANWRDYLAFFTGMREEYDEEADIRDSESYVAEREKAKDVEVVDRQGWFSKVFFRKK